jgi:hypothetical protein
MLTPVSAFGKPLSATAAVSRSRSRKSRPLRDILRLIADLRPPPGPVRPASSGLPGIRNGRLKAPLIHCVKGKDIMPYDGLSRRHALRAFSDARRRLPLFGIPAPRALCGDGGFNMMLCEFLTAVQHKLPVKAVVYNNSTLGLIRLEAESMGLPAWKAMDFPNPDYVALARACGGVGFKAEKPGELREAINQALKAEGPATIDCVVPADELPNVPHIDLEVIGNVAKAKIRR